MNYHQQTQRNLEALKNRAPSKFENRVEETDWRPFMQTFLIPLQKLLNGFCLSNTLNSVEAIADFDVKINWRLQIADAKRCHHQTSISTLQLTICNTQTFLNKTNPYMTTEGLQLNGDFQ